MCSLFLPECGHCLAGIQPCLAISLVLPVKLPALPCGPYQAAASRFLTSLPRLLLFGQHLKRGVVHLLFQVNSHPWRPAKLLNVVPCCSPGGTLSLLQQSWVAPCSTSGCGVGDGQVGEGSRKPFRSHMLTCALRQAFYPSARGSDRSAQLGARIPVAANILAVLRKRCCSPAPWNSWGTPGTDDIMKSTNVIESNDSHQHTVLLGRQNNLPF